MHRLSAALVLLSLCGRPALGQAPYSLRWGDAVSVFAAGVTAFIPEAMKLPKAAPSCAPCDATSLPSIDRSALHTFSGSQDSRRWTARRRRNAAGTSRYSPIHSPGRTPRPTG